MLPPLSGGTAIRSSLSEKTSPVDPTASLFLETNFGERRHTCMPKAGK